MPVPKGVNIEDDYYWTKNLDIGALFHSGASVVTLQQLGFGELVTKMKKGLADSYQNSRGGNASLDWTTPIKKTRPKLRAKESPDKK